MLPNQIEIFKKKIKEYKIKTSQEEEFFPGICACLFNFWKRWKALQLYSCTD